MGTNHETRDGLKLVRPRVVPVLNPDFRPAVLANRAFREAARRRPVPVRIAVERADGVSVFDTLVADASLPEASGNFTYVERLVKFLLWSRGGWKVWFSGPDDVGRRLQQHFAETPTGRFDADLMGRRIYERPFEVALADVASIPTARESTAPLGRHWNGCRIGFDLGASDRKVAAVLDGKTVFSEETVWDPRSQTNPQWHFDEIMDSLRKAAAHHETS